MRTISILSVFIVISLAIAGYGLKNPYERADGQPAHDFRVWTLEPYSIYDYGYGLKEVRHLDGTSEFTYQRQ